MKIKSRSGTADEKKYANKVIPVIKRHHLLLVTLMLWNAAATEALPIFLSGLVNEYLAILISVTLVLFLGEIIPAAILTGMSCLQYFSLACGTEYIPLQLRAFYSNILRAKPAHDRCDFDTFSLRGAFCIFPHCLSDFFAAGLLAWT